MKNVGNDLWWSQVRNVQEEQGPMDFRQAEIKTFIYLYKRMRDDGMLIGQIREHFEQAFNIRYTAFYTRLRKARYDEIL